MNTTTERRIPSQIRLDEAARLAGVTPNRLTGAWRQAKLVAPWSGVISTTDLVRAVVAAHLQRIFGEQSGVGLAIARAASEPALSALLNGTSHTLVADVGGAVFHIEFPAATFGAIREELLVVAGW
jgi:hypothetical protein